VISGGLVIKEFERHFVFFVR